MHTTDTEPMRYRHTTTTTVRAWDPSDPSADIPDEVIRRVCYRAAASLDTLDLSECAEDALDNVLEPAGVELARRRGALRTGSSPIETWAIDGQGAGAGVHAECVDVGKFYDAIVGPKIADPRERWHTRRRILRADAEGYVDLRTEPGTGFYPRTVCAADIRHPWPEYGPASGDPMDRALDVLADAWERYAEDIGHAAHTALESEWEYRTGWEHLREWIAESGEYVLEDGSTVPASDCEPMADDDDDDDGSDDA